jgi:hypothetical protein
MSKYKNLKELSEAFSNGEISRDDFFIMLDKGGSSISLDPRYTGEESDDEVDEKYEEAKKLFAGDRSVTPIEQALDALGIPYVWS